MNPKCLIAGAFIGLALGYVGVAFLLWQLDPGLWDQDHRATCILSTVICAWLGAMVSSMELGGKS